MHLHLLGKFKQLLSLRNLPFKGSLKDEQLEIITDAGILYDQQGTIVDIGNFEQLIKAYPTATIERIEGDAVALPGWIDCHTHICFGGNRAADYALRIAGVPYLEIAKQGGGIKDSVRKTRNASAEELLRTLLIRLNQNAQLGITTCEIKSGYGLDKENELKMLQVIQEAAQKHPIEIVPTCLAAHVCPPEFQSPEAYLEYVVQEIFPILKKQQLSQRIDIFVEETAFDYPIALPYLQKAQQAGFDITIHADQFSNAGSRLAVALNALSADHLEASGEAEIKALANSEVVAVVLPGASLGLGMPFAPARKLLDEGATVAIASDWNPGSAPMGDLLLQASVMAAQQKLSTAETFAALTFRAAKALKKNNIGRLEKGFQADLVVFPTQDYREILYWQGQMKPRITYKKGKKM
ncbi:MAG: imidazolonepropionase [Cytophagales bacterium]|nr:MAG: imidazolonepropionase [Cytophagales bacterium]